MRHGKRNEDADVYSRSVNLPELDVSDEAAFNQSPSLEEIEQIQLDGAPCCLKSYPKTEELVIINHDAADVVIFDSGDGTVAAAVDTEPHHVAPLKGVIKQAILAWGLMMAKVIPTMACNILIMFIIYLPAIVLTPQLIDKIRFYYFGVFFTSMRLTLAWTAIGTAMAYTFGYRYSSKGLILGIFPLLVIDNTFELTPQLNSNPGTVNVNNILRLFFLGLALFLVRTSKKYKDMPAEEELYYKLTKDGSPMALFKGIVGFFILVFILTYNVAKVYITSQFYMQIIFRLLVFPLCYSFSKWYQTSVLMGLSKEGLDKRLIANKICNHYIQFVGRIFVSNLSTGDALNFEFILVNVAGVLVDIISVLTFKRRMHFVFKVRVLFDGIYSKWFLCKKRKRLISIIPNDELPPQITPRRHTFVLDRENMEQKEMDFIDETIYFRSRFIFDELTSEVYSICLAPLLMFLMYPLVPKPTYFQVISSFWKCFGQILVQLVLEFFGGLFYLTYEMRCGRLKMEDVCEWKPMKAPLLSMWSTYCALSMCNYILYFSA